MNGNHISINKTNGLVMYIDMNSFFASCEQQLIPELRGKPIGVCPYPGPNAVVIAASKEAKKLGIKTGMLSAECKMLCPSFKMVPTRPVQYRRIHVHIMNILKCYFDADDIIPKSIDEAVINLTPYLHVYDDFIGIAKAVKKHIAVEIGEYVTCSIGISGNAFLAKLATEIQKPDGLIVITKDNLDGYLSKMKLTDLPGIARGNEKRLNRAGIYTPLEMRHTSEIVLRKALGGITGNYWHYRLHFKEVDMYTSAYKHMAAARSLSPETRSGEASLLAMLVALCTRLEQRMVKQGVFCRYLSFSASYYDSFSWKTDIKLAMPVQDSMEMMHYIEKRIEEYERITSKKIMCSKMKWMSVMVGDFMKAEHLQYGLFDNRMQKDKLRKVMYDIKDQYGKNMVRKASETVAAGQMKDAIGFGSVKDIYQSMDDDDNHFNKFLLEDDVEMEGHTKEELAALKKIQREKIALRWNKNKK